jgi:hypothetical protein
MYNIYQCKKMEHYKGLIPLESYIQDCVYYDQNERKYNHAFHTGGELHTFLTLSFTQLQCLDISWDENVCLEKIYVIGLPDFKSKENNLMLFIEKKDNKDMFVVSHIESVNILKEIINHDIFKLEKFKNMSQKEMFNILVRIYNFIDQLYLNALKYMTKIDVNNEKEKTLSENEDKTNYIQL